MRSEGLRIGRPSIACDILSIAYMILLLNAASILPYRLKRFVIMIVLA